MSFCPFVFTANPKHTILFTENDATSDRLEQNEAQDRRCPERQVRHFSQSRAVSVRL